VRRAEVREVWKLWKGNARQRAEENNISIVVKERKKGERNDDRTDRTDGKKYGRKERR
jgi:hypothetical protein